MFLSSGFNAREEAGAQTSHPSETVGLTTAFSRRLVLHIACCILASLLQLPTAGNMLPDSWKTRGKYL